MTPGALVTILLALLLFIGVVNYILVALLWFAAWGMSHFASKPAMLGGALLAIIWPLSLPCTVLLLGWKAPQGKLKTLYGLVRMLL